MRSILPFLITGVVTGSLYGLAGVGLVLTYRTSGVFNFGHGAIGAAAAFLFYTLNQSYGLAWPLAVLITIAFFAVVVGFIIERITRGLGDVPEAVVVLVTVGLLLGLEGLLFLLYGSTTRAFPEFLPASGFTVSGVTITWAQVISVIIATSCAFGLYGFLRRSRLGIAMRAVVDNPTLIALSGQRPAHIRQAAWAIGSGFAALSGILLAPTLNLDVNLLALLVVQAFGACAIGLFASLPLTYAGGLLVGVLASLATKYLTRQPFDGLPAAVPFLVLLVVLLVVPVAKLPRRRASLRSLVAESRPRSVPYTVVVTIAGLAALVMVPQLVGPKLPVWIAGLVNVIVFGSLAILVWTSGQISLCHAAFVAVGATTMSHLTTDYHLPWAVALALTGVITISVGAVVAIPAIRLSGLYLALATLGFGILMQSVIFPASWMFSTELTVRANRPEFGPFHGGDDRHFYYLVLVLAVLSLGVLVGITRSRLGRLLRAMAETPTMLSTHGLAVNMTRLIVFCISAFFAGIAGALVVTQYGAASGVGYGPIQSLVFLAVLAICGTRLLPSSILAGGLLAVLPGYLTDFGINRQLFAFGVIAVVAGSLVAKRAELAEWLRRAAEANTTRAPRMPAASAGRVPENARMTMRAEVIR